MVKNIFILVLFCSCSSITSNKNDFGLVRINKTKFKKLKEINSIDKNVIYRVKAKFNLQEDFKVWDNYKLVKNNFPKGIYYRFYSDGKMSYFDDFQEETRNFDPQKSYMGYYGYGTENNKNYVQYYRPAEPGKSILYTEEIKIFKDSIVTIWDNVNGSVLVPVKLEKIFLKTKPDW